MTERLPKRWADTCSDKGHADADADALNPDNDHLYIPIISQVGIANTLREGVLTISGGPNYESVAGGGTILCGSKNSKQPHHHQINISFTITISTFHQS